jgi:hypothetical protein
MAKRQRRAASKITRFPTSALRLASLRQQATCRSPAYFRSQASAEPAPFAHLEMTFKFEGAFLQGVAVALAE